MKQPKNMLAIERRENILNQLREDGSAKVNDLAKIYSVSEVTIRQDLEKLEKDGLITREHGGAYLKDVSSHIKNFELVNKVNLDKKAFIGAKAASYVQDGDTIILDSGSTTTEIAKHLVGKHNLTVITNALNIALMLGADPSIEVIMTGGEFRPPTLSLTGHKAADFFIDVHVDKLFLATAGISFRSGLTYPSLNDIAVKNAMINVAEEVFLVADSTKIGKGAFASLGGLSRIHYLITDGDIEPEHRDMFKEYEIELIIAGKE